MLELKKIKKVYKTTEEEVQALKNVSLKFRDSEFVSILGQSGCGKTTLLNIIGGLDNYTSGDLMINGKSTKSFNDRDWDTYRNHSVGFVFQSYNLIMHQNVLANVELALTLSGVGKKERLKKAKEVLKKVGLKDQMYKKPNQLSGGQMQRVAIARALINDPDVLLADEPTGALDSKTSIQIMELLKEVAKDKLVIMVTHNPALAEEYSTRIIKLLDGKIVDDSNPYEKIEESSKIKSKSKKTSMSFKTALTLSMNNLLTKKGRTILTAFAGSIGIIGIALILSLSNGIQKYIDKVEEETLSSYPISIQKESIDMSSMISSLAENHKINDYNDDKIHSVNIMGDMFETVSSQVKINDLASFKDYLENHESLKKYTSAIDFDYDVQLNLYKNDLENVQRVNPTTVLDAIGMGTSGMSSAYSSMMQNYDVFYELLDNEKLLKQQYDLVDGSWPQNYNEVVLQVDKNNQISDYTLYSLGILSQDDLKEQFDNMTAGKEVSFSENAYETTDLIGLSFKLLLNTDYYQKQNGIWFSKEDDENYIKEVLKNAEEIKIVGIIRPNEEAVVGTTSAGMVGYTKELKTHLINRINESQIVKEQKENSNINVLTGKNFNEDISLDVSNYASLRGLSEQEIASLIASVSQSKNMTYEQVLNKLGAADLSNPDTINIYPKDFEAKEQIEKIIDDYNKDKNEQEKITYTDIVGLMMSSVSTIVDVISTVLIAFVAISLVVSSIMIAIITYISVIERTKEIGILRAIGASKKDISRVFNAETLIEGLVAGILGIVVTILINIPANIIIKNMVNISGLSKLPIGGAIILIVISVLLTVIAGLIPSRIASKKDPVVALRSE